MRIFKLFKDFLSSEVPLETASKINKIFFYFSLIIVSIFYSVINLLPDWDLWARLAVGKIFFQIGHVLKNDIFSYTPTKDIWVDHEWGSGVIFYALADKFGDPGLLLLKIIGNLLLIFLISKIIKLQNTEKDKHTNILYYFFMIMGMYTGLAASVRCQLFSFIFFTLWLYILERVRRGETRLLWTIPATYLIWLNLHGGFIAGLGLLLIYTIGEFINKKPYKKYLTTFLLTCPLTLINPYGWKFIPYILDAATMPRPTISEWRATPIFGSLKSAKEFKVFLIPALYGLIAHICKLFKKTEKPDAVKLILIAVTFYLAIAHIKHQAFFVIAAGSFLYHDFYSAFESMLNLIREQGGKKAEKLLNLANFIKNSLIFFLLIGIGLPMILERPLKLDLKETIYPIKSVEFLRINNFSGNMLTVFQWGSYCIWKLYPKIYLAEDGRYEETYPEYIHNAVFDFDYKVGKNWNRFTNQYHTDILLLNKKHPSYKAILKNKFWKIIYDDKISAVFVPANKVKKNYIYPQTDLKTINNQKYLTNINFRD